MEGEPGYCGKIGRVEHVDSIGQIHGTWGGCAIQPERDSYELLTEDQAVAIREEEIKKRVAEPVPYVDGAKKVSVTFKCQCPIYRMGTKEVMCRVDLDLNGCCDSYAKVDSYGNHGSKACIIGVPDNECARVYGFIKKLVGQDCCPQCVVAPADLRKLSSDYYPAIKKAVLMAIGKEEA